MQRSQSWPRGRGGVEGRGLDRNCIAWRVCFLVRSMKQDVYHSQYQFINIMYVFWWFFGARFVPGLKFDSFSCIVIITL